LLELTIDRTALQEWLADSAFGPKLMEIWDAVHEVAPFAFRALEEISAYILESEAVRDGWERPLDEQILQKVLPRIRGGDASVGPCLEQLLDASDGDLPLTHATAVRMQEAFATNGFTGYF
jgi:hypothetical protein